MAFNTMTETERMEIEMAYIITTTTEGPLAPTQPLVWNGEGVVGICRFNEAAEVPH